MLASRQGGVDWLELSAEKAAQPGLAVVGKMDLGVAYQNVPAAAPYVSAGSLLLKANVGEPKDGMRKLGFSGEVKNLTLTLPTIGTAAGLEAKALGRMDWGPEGPVFLDDLELTANGLGGILKIDKLDWKRDGAVSWQSARMAGAWVSFFSQSWLRPNRWVQGDLVFGEGFWEPSDHGAPGQIDVVVEDGTISEQPKSAKIFCRLNGNWSFENRIQTFSLKDASLKFTETYSNTRQSIDLPPVTIGLLEIGPGSFDLKAKSGGTLDLRGILDQYGAWQPRPTNPGSSQGLPRIDITAGLDEVILSEARLGPVSIEALQVGADGIRLQSFSVGMLGRPAALTASIQKNSSNPQKKNLLAEARNFPLAVFAPWLKPSGSLDGILNAKINGVAAMGSWSEFVGTGAGSLWLHVSQSSLQNLPLFRESLLEEAGRSLGSQDLIPSSQLDSFTLACTLQNSELSISSLQITGSALELGLTGNVNLANRQLNLKGPLGLTREAIQSCGVLQGLVLDNKLANSSDLYVKMPGDLEVSGTLDQPRVDFDKLKAFWRGALNLGIGLLQGTGDAASGAAGGAAGAAGSILQGVGNLFKGF